MSMKNLYKGLIIGIGVSTVGRQIAEGDQDKTAQRMGPLREASKELLLQSIKEIEDTSTDTSSEEPVEESNNEVPKEEAEVSEESVEHSEEALNDNIDTTGIENELEDVDAEIELEIKEMLQLEFINTVTEKQLTKEHGVSQEMVDTILKERPFHDIEVVKSIPDIPKSIFEVE